MALLTDALAGIETGAETGTETNVETGTESRPVGHPEARPRSRTGAGPESHRAAGRVPLDRRPAVRTRRPAGERPLNRRPAPSGPRHVAPAACTVRPAARPLRFLVLVALAAAAATVLLGMLASAGGSLHASAGPAGVPSGTSVTQVRAGESMWDVARRSVPSADPAAVVDRIVTLNPAAPATLHAGEPLIVPATAGRGR